MFSNIRLFILFVIVSAFFCFVCSSYRLVPTKPAPTQPAHVTTHLKYLYTEEDTDVFMDKETFTQVAFRIDESPYQTGYQLDVYDDAIIIKAGNRIVGKIPYKDHEKCDLWKTIIKDGE